MEKPLSINSKNRIDQVNREENLMNKHIVQLMRERFYPLVRFCGPQSAGGVEIEGCERRSTSANFRFGCGRPKALTTEFCPMNNSATWFRHIAGSQSAVVGADCRCNVCHVTWTGLKRPTETPCHYCAITSKIPLQRSSMGWLWDGYWVHGRARQRNEPTL